MPRPTRFTTTLPRELAVRSVRPKPPGPSRIRDSGNAEFYRLRGGWATGGARLSGSEHYPRELCEVLAESVMSAATLSVAACIES